MSPVSLTYDELLRLIRLSLYAVFAVAAVHAWFYWDEILLEPLERLIRICLTSVGILTVLIVLFSKLAWTSTSLAFIFGRRNVHGLWWGELRTDYVQKESSDQMDPIKIAFVIKQTYLFLSIQSFTVTQQAHSTQATLKVDPTNAKALLQYVFEMQRQNFGENHTTFGYGNLRLVSKDNKLEGNYWTSSPTKGTIHLDLISRDCDGIDSFEDAHRVCNSRSN